MNIWIIVALCSGAFGVGFAIAFFMRSGRVAAAEAQIHAKTQDAERLAAELTAVRGVLSEKSEELAKTQANLDNAVAMLDTQKAETVAMQKTLTTEFENIANRVLKERAAELSESSRKEIGALLNPLGERINEFKNQVKEAYSNEMREKTSLREQIKLLTEQNARISDEANNLAKALKGDVKKQGNWGEIILERVLEISGLHKGREYEREEVSKNADGSNSRPDVVVHLPDNKHIIIDSKVSLVAYERLTAAADKEAYAAALKEHMASMKKHVQELSDKNYPNLLGLNAPDFVLMFVPIEAMFTVAVEADQNLFAYAWERKIVIVSPTTLLATLRTIASIWRQDNQTKNSQEIARLGGSLYDKLVGFVDDMQKIKKSIDAADKCYNDAMNKLTTGSGNAIRTAAKIKNLGVKTGKELPQELIED